MNFVVWNAPPLSKLRRKSSHICETRKYLVLKLPKVFFRTIIERICRTASFVLCQSVTVYQIMLTVQVWLHDTKLVHLETNSSNSRLYDKGTKKVPGSFHAAATLSNARTDLDFCKSRTTLPYQIIRFANRINGFCISSFESSKHWGHGDWWSTYYCRIIEQCTRLLSIFSLVVWVRINGFRFFLAVHNHLLLI